MTYPLGAIILIKKYQLPTEEKDKFFIVIGKQGHDYNLLSMTTSQFYFSPELIKGGVINKDSGASMYCFEARKVICENGFSFSKPTFISHNNNIHQFSFDLLNAYNVELKGILFKEELKDLIYSFYQYKRTPRKHKEILELILQDLFK